MAASDDQSAVVAFLSDPATHGGEPVERAETHCAIVFLAGDRAWKLKRAVTYAFLDFASLDARRAACEAEIRLNSRTAPEIYQRAVPVTREADGRLAIGGAGEVVDWLVAMRRFPADGLFDVRADRGDLNEGDMRALADAIADLHAKAERVTRPVSTFGDVIAGNLRAAGTWVGEPFDRGALAAIAAGLDRAFAAARPLLDARAADGHVRVAHGDLHLGNVCTVDGRPVIFDALEFDPDLARIDVLYDLAFVVMDLWTRGFERFAHLVLERWIARTGDDQGLALLPLFLSLRALIRAHVAAATAARASVDKPRQGLLRAVALERLTHARAFLAPAPPRLVAVGGLSGTGKSTVAQALAPGIGAAPGARLLRTDVIRKRLAGVPETERLPPDAYTVEANAAVYDRLFAEAETALAQGRAAIIDGVFAREGERARAAELAHRLGVRFHGLWLEAPEAVLRSRVESRRGDASDADAAVLGQQLGFDLGRIDWARVSADGAPAAVAARAADALGRPAS
jgi:aminoglycoside phosphotransferase family enzyme/predicted kinase